MTLQVLSLADTHDIACIASVTIQEFQKKGWIKDVYLEVILDRLKIETEVLVAAEPNIRTNEFAQKLMVQDALCTQIFNGIKQFVKANTYSVDRDKVKNADMIWAVFEAHDILPYRLAYDEQIFLCESLLKTLDKEHNQKAIASLDGVMGYVALLKMHKNKLCAILGESKIDKQTKTESIAAVIQKNVVCHILNKELLPYLQVMSRANADVYRLSLKAISEYITSVNTKIKDRNAYFTYQVKAQLMEEINN
ncbi:hypothetical protein EO244_14990 [Ancylomarina salipaludis]|uniref:Uncharacterized protein n=1 Tax=Ancylomarina salipaludis TaxID=2501299 RepID=A0A4Q1JIL5_9BACT|nr:DUF6261 family protein [Ancylomarina salipaludis]RXQ88832.1 hypothetical protein EO244_14990 [Ancylomarina salipaludis]